MCQFWSWERCHGWIALHCKVVTTLLTCNFFFPIPFEETFSNFLFLFFSFGLACRFVLLPDRRLFFSRGLLKKIIMYIYLMMEIRRGLYKYRLLHLAWSCCACSCDAGVEFIFTPIAFMAKLEVSTTSPKPSCCKASFPLAYLFFNYCQSDWAIINSVLSSVTVLVSSWIALWNCYISKWWTWLHNWL